LSPGGGLKVTVLFHTVAAFGTEYFVGALGIDKIGAGQHYFLAPKTVVQLARPATVFP
jgi:hypothetical protein